MKNKGRIYIELVLLLATSIIIAIEWLVILCIVWIGFIKFGKMPIWLTQFALFIPNYIFVRYAALTDDETKEAIKQELDEWESD